MQKNTNTWRFVFICAVLAAPVVLLAFVIPAFAQSGYRMFVNHGAGWSEAGEFRTLAECKREAALYAAKHSAQAGCAAESALKQQASVLNKQAAETQFQLTAAQCAEQAGVEIILKPSAKVATFGTRKNNFEFERCMAQSGHPTE